MERARVANIMKIQVKVCQVCERIMHWYNEHECCKKMGVIKEIEINDMEPGWVEEIAEKLKKDIQDAAEGKTPEA